MVCSAEFIGAVTSESVNLSVDCLPSDGTPLQRSIAGTLVDVLQPIAAIFFFAIFWLVIKIRQNKSWTYLLKRCVLSTLSVFYISYISISRTLVQILNCVEVHDSNDATKVYWTVDTSVECYKESHAALAYLLAWPFLVIFTFGFPLAVACLVAKKVAEDYKDGWIYEAAGFMYQSFRKRYIFWESVIMFRKAVLTVVVVFSYKLGFDIQVVIASFVLILSLYFQMKFRPYREEFDSLNDVESLSILISSLTFVCSIFFGVDHVSDAVHMLISVLLCFTNVLFFLYLITLYAVYFTADYLKSVLVKEGIISEESHGAFRILVIYLMDYLFIIVKNTLMRWGQPVRARRYRRSEV